MMHRNKLTHPEYRPDIDGLRAIAVLAVVGFHSFPSWVPGGFIGVDIFFVISGYLISTIIFGSLERNSFSFVEFYVRRINRIFPALILVLIGCFAFGWLVLLADEYKHLGKHIAGGAGFISNFLLWNESGYFDNTAESKPLLHLWSLGIEEQFYVVWPLLLWLTWQKRFNLLSITIAVAAISFALNIVNVRDDTVAAFYSPQTRFWELMVGSVLAHMTLHRQHTLPRLKHWLDMRLNKIIYAQAPEANGKTLLDVQSILGAALIAIGILVVTKGRLFPGWWAVLPTLGTALIISAGTQAWVNRKFLSNHVLVWFGLISFPLYLWHWPLLSFSRIVSDETPLREIRLGAVLIAIVLAWLTYKLIEKPIRLGNHGKAKAIILFGLMAIVGYIGYNSYTRDGLSFRALPKKSESYTKSLAISDRAKECSNIPFAYEKNSDWYCELGDKNSAPKFFAYGDSHASSLLPAVEKFATVNKTKILFTASSGCPPLLGIQSERGAELVNQYNCQKLNERIFEFVKNNKIESVVLIGRWTYYTRGTTIPDQFNKLSAKINDVLTIHERDAFIYGIHQTILKYKHIGVRVYFVEDNPHQEIDPKDALKKSKLTDLTINRFSVSVEEHKRNQSWVSNEFKKIEPGMATFINFDNLLCGNEKCPLVKEGKFLYTDANHLSADGAMLVYPNLMKALSPP